MPLIKLEMHKSFFNYTSDLASENNNVRVPTYLNNRKMLHVLHRILKIIFCTLIRESYYKWLVRVEGLTYPELRHLKERLGLQGERLGDLDITEFSLPSWMLLNALESLGYSVLEVTIILQVSSQCWVVESVIVAAVSLVVSLTSGLCRLCITLVAIFW